MDNLPKCSAVYAFENITDSKLYIGSSVNAYRRVQHHFYLLNLGKHHNKYLQRAYAKHGKDKFHIFALEGLPDCTTKELLSAEQKWISTFDTTNSAHGYNIHPTPITGDAAPSAEANQRLRETLVGRRRGVLSDAGRAAHVEHRRRRWEQPKAHDFMAKTMRDLWATPEHRAKVDATIVQRQNNPDEVAAMRARLDANRMSGPEIAVALADVWWRMHASDKFPSNTALDDWIVDRYADGLSARQIGLSLGMSHNACARRLRDRGLALPKHRAKYTDSRRLRHGA